MAVLSAQERKRTLAQLMREVREDFGCSKADLQAAVDGIDDFFNSNATSINLAFPATSRASLSAAQKATVVGYVAFRRAGRLRAEEDG